MKKALLFTLKLLLTAACLGWAFSRLDIGESIFSRPGSVHYGWLAGGAALAGATVWLTAVRWRLFLHAQDVDPGMRRAVELTLIGNLFNLLSVGGIGGDAARILLLIRQYPGRKLAVAMAVMVDHLAGMVAMSGMFFLISSVRFESLQAQSSLGKGVIHFAWFYLGGGLLFVGLTFLVACPPVYRWLHRGGRQWRSGLLQRVPQTYDVYRKKWPLALAGVGVSVVMLLAYFLSFWCGLRAVGGEVPAISVVSAMPVIDSLSSLPVSVAGVGVREKLFEVLLHDLAGVEPAMAVAASLAGFACNVLWALPGALFFLRKGDRVTIRELEDVERA